MKKNIFVMTIMIALLVITGCTSCAKDEEVATVKETVAEEKAPETPAVFAVITAEEAKKMMDEGGVTVVDVRRPEEYDKYHIPGAILVTNETIIDAPAELPDKDATLLIYCRSGRRSAEASKKLQELGYTHIYDFGGIIDWPYDLEY